MPSRLRPFAELRGPTGAPITLYRADSLRELPHLLAPRSVDVVVTSPPYNLGVAYDAYDDDRPRAEYLRWIRRFGRTLEQLLAEDGALFLNVGGPPSDPGWPWEVARAAGGPFVLQNVIHWVKSIAIDRGRTGRSVGLERNIAVGHYKPVNSRRYLNSAHEYVFQFTRRGDLPLDRLAIGVPYQDKSNVGRWGRSRTDRRCRGNTWFLPYSTIRERARDRPHPATFPPELPEWCLRLHGLERLRLAVDPFVGIGASAVAAVRTGVNFVGFDLDEEYLRVAAERVRSERSRRAPERRASPGRAAARPR